jgi:hypothetical protein
MSFQYNEFQQPQGGSASPTATGGAPPAVPQQGQPSASPAPYPGNGAAPGGGPPSGDGAKTTLWYVSFTNVYKQVADLVIGWGN